MDNSIEIIPSILTANPHELAELVKKADGVVTRVHIDILDGVFADNKTIDPIALEHLEHSLMLDFHLMVNEPVRWVEKCLRAGADRVIGQVEMMSDIAAFIIKCQEVGVAPGLAVDINTKISSIEKRLLTDVDVVLVMSVPAGFGGQKFHAEALTKIKELNEVRKHDKTPYKICDDGGVTLEKVDDVVATGADQVVIGQRIFEGDLAANIAKYQSAQYE